jgi:hypothetical protein
MLVYVSIIINNQGGVWKDVVGFFIVGHMDEDINGSYGYLSTILKKISMCW